MEEQQHDGLKRETRGRKRYRGGRGELSRLKYEGWREKRGHRNVVTVLVVMGIKNEGRVTAM